MTYLRLALLSLTFATGCTQKTDLDKLELKDNYYYAQGKSSKFTGQAISKLSNGKPSNVLNFRNGVPDGRWKAYGYDGVVVQEGENHVVKSVDRSALDPAIIRLNVQLMIELDYREKDVLAIVKDPSAVNKNTIKQNVMAYLKSHPDLLGSDTLHSIQVLAGELEKWEHSK